MSEINAVLGKNIRELRQKCGWTQETLAEKASISVPFMTQIELARKSASLEVVENIAKALGVPYERLFKTSAILDNETNYTLNILKNDLLTSVTELINAKFDRLK